VGVRTGGLTGRHDEANSRFFAILQKVRPPPKKNGGQNFRKISHFHVHVYFYLFVTIVSFCLYSLLINLRVRNLEEFRRNSAAK
jgi:hypothetical protein